MRRIGTLFFGFVFAGAAALAASQPSSAGPREDLSVEAGRVLDATNQARVAIKNGNGSAALHQVERAQSDLRNLNAHAQGATVIPIYKEFVSISILDPVRAEQNSRRANGAVVHQVAADYTNVALDTRVANQNLEAAKKALTLGDMHTADEALADVQEGVSITEVESDLPLAKARENLILARYDAEKNNYTAEAADLKAASHALASYSAEGGPHAAAAKALQQQIDSFDQNLQQNGSAAVSKINNWWDTTSNWSAYKPQQQLNAHR